jgi:hypothetical protein
MLLSEKRHFTNEAEKETELGSWWIVSWSLFSGDLKSDKREQ